MHSSPKKHTTATTNKLPRHEQKTGANMKYLKSNSICSKIFNFYEQYNKNNTKCKIL